MIGILCLCYIGTSVLSNWQLISQKLMMSRGEAGIGNWTVIVEDCQQNELHGTFLDWRLNLWGESLDAEHQTRHPYPNEDDDNHETTSAIVSTTYLRAGSPVVTIPPSVRPLDCPGRLTKLSTSSWAVVVTAATTIAVPTSIASEVLRPIRTHPAFPKFERLDKMWNQAYGVIGLIMGLFFTLVLYVIVKSWASMRCSSREGDEFELMSDFTENGDE
jgi:kexin